MPVAEKGRYSALQQIKRSLASCVVARYETVGRIGSGCAKNC